MRPSIGVVVVVLLALRAAWIIHVRHQREQDAREFSSARMEFLGKRSAYQARERLYELPPRPIANKPSPRSSTPWKRVLASKPTSPYFSPGSTGRFIRGT